MNNLATACLPLVSYRDRASLSNYTATVNLTHSLLHAAQGTVKQLVSRIAALNAELGTDVQATLTAEEQRELAGLNPALQALKDEATQARAVVAEAQARRSAQENVLHNNLALRKQVNWIQLNCLQSRAIH